MRRVALGVGLALLVLFAVLAVRAATMKPYRVAASTPDRAIAAAAVSPDRLTGALRFPTISTQEASAFDPQPFLALHEYLRTAFPRVHASLEREVVGGYSLLYTWRGSDTSLAPILLMGHLDVVPVESGTEASWKHPPFAGMVADDFIWGRGALDDKSASVAVMEAVELLLERGFRPRHTIYLAFGHDEELGGFAGARAMAGLIKERSGRLDFLLDEGGVIAGEGLIPGVARQVALVGVVEKATLNVELTVEGTGGHSSMPPAHTAVGVLSRAITRLEDNPLPPRLTPVSEAMFGRLAPEMPFGRRLLMANLWLFRPLVVSVLARGQSTAATMRTTTAATMVSGSPKANVLPIKARAIVNFRILPGETAADVLAHVRRVVADSTVRVSVSGTPNDPSPVADYRSPQFAVLERTIVQLFPDAVPVPFLMVGGTDTRHYESLTRNVFRFNPFVATPEMISGAHGTNERIRAGDFARGVQFYAQLILNSDGK